MSGSTIAAKAAPTRALSATFCAGAIAITALLVLAMPVHAKRLYKYQDEDGIWHYTDRKPDTDQPVEERLLEVDPKSPVTARQHKIGRQTRYHFTNHRHGPVEVEIELTEAKNVQTIPATPARIVLPEAGEQLLLTVGPKDPRAAWSYRLTYRAMLGDPDARADQDFAYQVPFTAGSRYYIGQAFGGTATHTAPQARHAIDVTMPVGTPITAARDGIVMHVEEDFFGNGKSLDRYGNRANHVRILHDDGSMGLYAHLDTESVKVRAGQVVTTGEVIGKSGNTGYSTGPHLHFAIQHNTGMQLETVPFVFSDGAGGSFEPRAQHWLEHQSAGTARIRR